MEPFGVTKTSCTLFTAFIFIHSEVAVFSTPLGRPVALEAAAPEEAAAFKETLSLISGSCPSGFSAISLFCSSPSQQRQKASQASSARHTTPAQRCSCPQTTTWLPARTPHTHNGCGKVRRRKVLRKEKKVGRGRRLKGHFDTSTAFLPEKQSHCSADFKSLEVKWSHRPRKDL